MILPASLVKMLLAVVPEPEDISILVDDSLAFTLGSDVVSAACQLTVVGADTMEIPWQNGAKRQNYVWGKEHLLNLSSREREKTGEKLLVIRSQVNADCKDQMRCYSWKYLTHGCALYWIRHDNLTALNESSKNIAGVN